MDAIRDDVRAAVDGAGLARCASDGAVTGVDDGLDHRRRPPGARRLRHRAPVRPGARDRRPSAGRSVPVTLSVRCPRCASPNTHELSRFGSTACKSLWRCRVLPEPFDHFKAI